jgi:hypothetical protein
MSRSIKDMLNLSDHITSPSHTHAMFDKTDLFSSDRKKEYWSSTTSLCPEGDIFAVTRIFFVYMYYYCKSATTSHLKQYKCKKNNIYIHFEALCICVIGRSLSNSFFFNDCLKYNKEKNFWMKRSTALESIYV